MGDQLVNLTRPDGTVLQATESDAEQLRQYGYKDQDVGARAQANVEVATEAYYSTPGQKVKTAVEGFTSGLTLGGSDKLLELATDAGITGDEWRSRSEYNPGTRLGSELVGAIAPSFFSGGTLTPAGALVEGGRLATRGVEGVVARSVARGAIEGAGFGLGAEVSQSALTGDPLTVEGSLAGMGWGAVWGGGLGAVAGGLEKGIARKAAVKAEAGAAAKLVEENYGAFRGAVREAGTKADEAFRAVEMEIGAQAGAEKLSKVKTAERATGVFDEAADIRNKTFNESWTEHPGVRAEKKAAIAAYNDMKSAYQRKDWGAMERSHEKFITRLDEMEQARNVFQGSMPESKPLSVGQRFEAPPPNPRVEAMKDAMSQVKDLATVSSTLRAMSESPMGFASMSPARFEKAAGALETFLKHPAAELSGTQEAIKSTIAKMAEGAGVKVEGNATAQLRGLWESVRNVKSASGVADAAKVAEGKLPWGQKVAQTGAGVAIGKAIGGGFGGYALGRTIANGLLGMKGAVMKTVADATEKWAPRAQKAVRYLGPQGSALMTKLDGTEDVRDKRKSDTELAIERMKEIHEAAPTIRDRIYKQLAPINMYYPEYAAAMHEQMVNQFTYLYNQVPRDPGNAFNRLESLYKPPPEEVAKFKAAWEIFHNPVKAAVDFANGRRVSPQSAAALSNMWPAVWNQMRQGLIQRFSDPEVLSKMQYDDQVQMSLLTGIRMHSTMRPEFIASQQQMFQERNQPLPMAKQPGAPGGEGGRPSGDSPYMTQAQKSTSR